MEDCPICNVLDANKVKEPRRSYLHRCLELEFQICDVMHHAEDAGVEVTDDEIVELAEQVEAVMESQTHHTLN